MKKIDLIHFSIESIKKNKARSILTTFIVYLISLLIMCVFCVLISFNENINNITEEELLNSNIKIIHTNNEPITLDEYYDFIDLVEKNKSVVSNIYTNSSSIYNFKYFNEKNIKIVKGEKPNILLEGKAVIYLPLKYINEYNIGDNYLLKISDENYNFEIKGFFESDIVNTYLIDMTYYLVNVNSINNFVIEYYHTSDQDIWESIEKLKIINDGIGDIFLNPSSITSSKAIENFTMTKIINIVVILGAIFIDVILLLLSIGSVSNTVMISVDQKRKFFGLLKTEGLDNYNIFMIILFECIFTIFIGILLSFITLFMMKPILEKITLELIETVVGYTFGNTDLIFKFFIPLYIPVVCCVFIVLSTLFFARKAFKDFFKLNPMDIMQEDE